MIGVFVGSPVDGFDLDGQGVPAVDEFGMLRLVCLAVDAVGQVKLKKAIQLASNLLMLSLEIGGMLASHLGNAFALGLEHLDDPATDLRILDPEGSEQGLDLLVQVPLVDADARMALGVVPAAAVVAILPLAGLRLLGLDLDDQRAAAVAAGDHARAVDGRMGVVGLPAQEDLHAAERSQVDQRLMRARVPGVGVQDLADVGAIPQDAIERASVEGGSVVGKDDPRVSEGRLEAVERVAAVGVQFEDPPDLRGVDGIDFDQAPTLDADIAVAEGSLGREQPFLHAAGLAFLHVDALLLGVEGGHVREDAPLHATGGRVLRRLGDIDDLQAGVSFEPFELDIVEQIPGGPVDLVEQQAGQLGRMLAGVGQQFLERLPLGLLAGGLGDPEQLDDLPALPPGVPLEGVLLDVQREAFPLLLPTGHPSQPDEPCLADHASPPFASGPTTISAIRPMASNISTASETVNVSS